MNRQIASDAAIAQVDLEISELEKLLQDIGIALLMAQERRADLVVYTAPIHSLHKEILLEIFQIVVDSEFHSPPQLHPSGSPALLLSQIARRWRHVVTGTPSLWATFQVSFRASLDLLATHLQRSKDLPLRIGLVETGRFDLVERETVPPALSLLASRYQYLNHLQILADHLWSRLPDYLQDATFPRLQSLDIYNSDNSVAGFFLRAGFLALSFVRLSGIYPGVFTPGPALREMHIEAKLGWSEFEHEGFTRIAAQGPSLESLTIVQLAKGFAGQLWPCLVPSLKKLSLLQLPGDESYARCADIVSPSLETLVLAETSFSATSNFESIFRDNLISSIRYPQLRSLSLIKVELASPITQATLATLSSLEHLLVDMNHTDSLLDSLTTQAISPATVVLLPRLRTLELVSGTFTNMCLSAMLAARPDINHKILLQRVDAAVG